MRMSTYVLIAVAPVNLALNVFLVHYTPLGLLGAPLAISITFWLCFVLLVTLTYLSPAHRSNGTWAGFQPGTVLDISSCVYFLKLAVPGILMVGTEWHVFSSVLSSPSETLTLGHRAAFEIVALAAGRLGSLPLAAQSVIMTTDQSECSPHARIRHTHNMLASHEHHTFRDWRRRVRARREPHWRAVRGSSQARQPRLRPSECSGRRCRHDRPHVHQRRKPFSHAVAARA